MLLYPRLRHVTARKVARELARLSIPQLAAQCAVSHPDAIYSPTGGSRVSTQHLRDLQTAIHDLALENRYPASSRLAHRQFDASLGELLHQRMQLSPAEASHGEVWAFLACVLAPDIVRWRFPGSGKADDIERFLGNLRGLRNALGRTWWRAYLLHDPGAQSPYHLLAQLGEDELVQITERPNLAGSRQLVQQLVRSFLAALENASDVRRSELLRDTMKRIRRVLPLVSFDAVDGPALRAIVDEVIADSVNSLRRCSAIEPSRADRPPPLRAATGR